MVLGCLCCAVNTGDVEWHVVNKVGEERREKFSSNLDSIPDFLHGTEQELPVSSFLGA